jgi:hypothetical protein
MSAFAYLEPSQVQKPTVPRHFSSTLFLLCGLGMITSSLDLPMPLSALLSYHGLSSHAGELMDMPISFTLPLHGEICVGALESQQGGQELGKSFPERNVHRSQG